MNEFLRNKLNILLITVLLAAVAGIGFFTFNDVDLSLFEKKVEMLDLSNMNEQEVIEWAQDNKIIDLLKVEHVFSEEIEINKLISQSLNSGEKVLEEFKVVYSLGKDPDKAFMMPSQENLTKADLEKFFTENSFTNVSFIYEVDESEKDTIIKMPSGIVKRSEEIIITLSAGNTDSSLTVTVPDFKTYSLSQVKMWGSSNGVTIKVDYDLSDTVKRGDIIKQSIKTGEEVNIASVITVVVSDGVGVTVPDFTNKTKTDIEKWVKENNIEEVTYLTEFSSTVAKDGFVKISPKAGTKVSVDYPIKVTISSGLLKEVKTGYEGKSVAEFKKYIEDLGLKPVESTIKYYSLTYTKGTVHSYATGKFEPGKNVDFYTSLGAYVPNVSEYNGLTKANAETKLKTYTDLKADATISFTTEESTNEVGKTFGCAVNGKNIACKIARPSIDANAYNGLSKDTATSNMNNYKNQYGVGSIEFDVIDTSEHEANKTYGCALTGSTVKCNIAREPLNAITYNGLSRSAAENKMSTYKNTYGIGTIVFSYGNVGDVDKTYDCTLSGNQVACSLYRMAIDVNDYNNRTKTSAENKMASYKSKYGVGEIVFTEVETDQYTAGNTFGATLDGNTVRVNIAKAPVVIPKQTISKVSVYRAINGSSFEDTKEKIFASTLGEFNTTVLPASQDPNYNAESYVIGYIFSIYVNGSSNYSPGEYPLDTNVVVYVVD